jgi:MipA family protein
MRRIVFGLAAAALLSTALPSLAADVVDVQQPARERFYSGDWSLTIGAAGIYMPEFDGASEYHFVGQPLISLGRQGTERRFTSRNDNISIGLIDTGSFRAGPTGKIIFGRDSGDFGDIRGLDDVDFGAELGVFAEFYPLDWMRMRGEVRRGIASHDGFVGDVAVDAFAYLTPRLRISGGPRLTYGTDDYFDAYYGVNTAESIASGLSTYSPDSGIASYGLGGALTFKATDHIDTSLFGEWRRLDGPAEDSSIVQERGDRDQFTVGVSATYRFDFSL